MSGDSDQLAPNNWLNVLVKTVKTIYNVEVSVVVEKIMTRGVI